jgi:hypothetical protein
MSQLLPQALQCVHRRLSERIMQLTKRERMCSDVGVAAHPLLLLLLLLGHLLLPHFLLLLLLLLLPFPCVSLRLICCQGNGFIGHHMNAAPCICKLQFRPQQQLQSFVCGSRTPAAAAAAAAAGVLSCVWCPLLSGFPSLCVNLLTPACW